MDASPSLRSKSYLIMAFVDKISVSPGEDWSAFIDARREAELAELIDTESLKGPETRELLSNAFRDGAVQTSGTAVTKIMPPMSRFAAGGDHGAKKQRVLDKLRAFYERYAGL